MDKMTQSGNFASDQKYSPRESAPHPPSQTRRFRLTWGDAFLFLLLGCSISYWLFLTNVPNVPAASNTKHSYTFWDMAVPSHTSIPEDMNVEVGLRFSVEVEGEIQGLRFYKGEGNTGLHSGHLWASNGIILATSVFTNESNDGWQYLQFETPIDVHPGENYIASYFAPNGHYAFDLFFFTQSYKKGPLIAYQDQENQGNGLFKYGGGFPDQSYKGANYWVDVLFQTKAVDK